MRLGGTFSNLSTNVQTITKPDKRNLGCAEVGKCTQSHKCGEMARNVLGTAGLTRKGVAHTVTHFKSRALSAPGGLSLIQSTSMQWQILAKRAPHSTPASVTCLIFTMGREGM